MTGLPGFSLLLVLTVLPIRAAPLTGLEPVPCDETGAELAAKLTVQHMNQHHYHGYKFNLDKVASVVATKSDSKCVLELKLDLLETKCHFLNPKPYDECEVRSEQATPVTGDCKATVTVADGRADVTKYTCVTEPMPAANVTRMCPDCSTLLPLTSPEGIKAVRQGLDQFHKGNYTQRWKLLEVGRILSGYMPPTGMFYSAEFAVVETSCPFNARIVPEACRPLCPATARYGLCSSTLYGDESLTLSCEIYEAQNSSSQDPERKCELLHHHGHEDHGRHHGDKGHEGRHGHEGHEGRHGHEGKEGRHGHEGHEGRHGHEGHEGRHGPGGRRPGVPPSPTNVPPGHPMVLPFGQGPSGPHGKRPNRPRLPPHCQAEKIHPICPFPPLVPLPPPPPPPGVVPGPSEPRLDQA